MEQQIKVETSENININANISIEVEGIRKNIMNMYSSLNAENFGINININVIDKELYKSNAEAIKQEYEKFKKNVENRATTLGYVIF